MPLSINSLGQLNNPAEQNQNYSVLAQQTKKARSDARKKLINYHHLQHVYHSHKIILQQVQFINPSNCIHN